MYEFGKWYLATGLVLGLFLWTLPRASPEKMPNSTWRDVILFIIFWLPFLAYALMKAYVAVWSKHNDSK